MTLHNLYVPGKWLAELALLPLDRFSLSVYSAVEYQYLVFFCV